MIHLKRRNSQKLTMCANVIALAFIFSYLESLFPFSLGIPGVKLGLANIITVYVLYMTKNFKTTFIVIFVRIFLVAFTFGNLSTMIYSICGAILSGLGMVMLYKTGIFTIIGVSIAGGVLHNVGQILCAMLILETNELIYYLPVLLFSGIICGFGVGFISNICVTNLKKFYNSKENLPS